MGITLRLDWTHAATTPRCWQHSSASPYAADDPPGRGRRGTTPADAYLSGGRHLFGGHRLADLKRREHVQQGGFDRGWGQGVPLRCGVRISGPRRRRASLKWRAPRRVGPHSIGSVAWFVGLSWARSHPRLRPNTNLRTPNPALPPSRGKGSLLPIPRTYGPPKPFPLDGGRVGMGVSALG